MAILTDGVNGPVTGRLGNVIFYQVKGQNRARSLPRIPKRGRKPSPEQVMQRSKFRLMQQWLKPMKRIVRIGFGRFEPPKTGHNVAMSYNMRHAIVETENGFSVDPQAIRFSAGPLTPPVNAQVHQEGEMLHFSWDKPDIHAVLGDARTVLFVHNERNGLGCDKLYGSGADDCSDALATHFLSLLPGDVCHAYMAFVNAETGEVSDSVYAGQIVVVIE
ncbi:DUF6266 family protein [Parapedobacter indicus]|uniref:Uncharacterized protein n=1 Tax=Parapedobacter indicus TaxID=1477437 RepID=A0A1I3QRY2_9SPHI|nr:DUF6266 family protein [Parapedobacter indicus]PPL00227.1 hypothetical protein CLV26_109105 [Parapedobacter indicus]SFJ37023.1 hypothetical protein SAMN05444682_109105 [Parapedobacter indicus]